ncbi:MAG: CPBP family intramembrane metalloprotease [Deltaproteobacteria bacterium]|nr:CPBP family intramembrane metalloprotease [Deltaproteobacteria bacterium]
MRSRLFGLIVVAIAAWNGAFIAAQRFGLFNSVAVAAALLVLRSLAVPTEWRKLFAPRRDALVVAAIATPVLVGATLLLRGPVLGAVPALSEGVGQLYAMLGSTTLVQAYVLLPLTAIAEEVVFRGVIQGALEPRLTRFGAPVAAACIYAAAHVASENPTLLALALVMGLVWGCLRAFTGSLWPGIASHVLWDLVVMIWSPLPAVVHAGHSIVVP